MNKEDYGENALEAPLSRLKMMHELNTEMLKEMSKHWSLVHKCDYGDFHFLTYSKIKTSDTKNLRKYAEILEDREGLQLADYYSEL